jgi:hypothetical protein
VFVDVCPGCEVGTAVWSPTVAGVLGGVAVGLGIAALGGDIVLVVCARAIDAVETAPAAATTAAETNRRRTMARRYHRRRAVRA